MVNFKAGNPKASVAVGAVVTSLATMLLILIGITGLTRNSAPTNEIYLGSANISKIKVAKVMPETTNIVQFLGLALDANKMKDEDIFAALDNLAPTEALKPLLDIMINVKEENFVDALKALDGLKELSGSTNPNDTAELLAIDRLMHNSTDLPTSLGALKDLVDTSLPMAADPVAQQVASNLTVLLSNSLNPERTVRGLYNLTKISSDDRSLVRTIPLQYVSQSSNVTLYAKAMGVIADDASSDLVTNAVSVLQRDPSKANDSIADFVSSFSNDDQSKQLSESLVAVVRLSTNITSTIDAISQLTKERTRAVLTSAYADIFTTSSLAPGSILQTMMSISELQEGSSNDTLIRQAKLLNDMHTILSNTNDQKASLLTIAALNAASTNKTKVAAVPHLFALTSYATNPVKVFDGMVGMSSYGINHPEVLHPVLDVLSVAAESGLPARNVSQLQALGRRILGPFDIPEIFRLGLFNLQAIRVNGTTKLFSDGTVVQGFDYRTILYEQLLDSGLKYYVKALDIKPETLQLQGELLDKQPLYKPAIFITFFLYLIALIAGLFLMISLLGVSFGKINDSPRFGWLNRILALLLAGGTVLAASVVSLTIQIIKHGSAKDDYGVVFRHGPAYYGLVWSAAILSVITVTAVWLPLLGKKSSVNLEEGHASTSDEDLEKDKALRSHTSSGR